MYRAGAFRASRAHAWKTGKNNLAASFANFARSAAGS
jgi:hypothetical protein